MFNMELPVVKRYNADISEAHENLVSNGFEVTGTIMDGGIRYYENAGVGVTLIDGPFGTSLIPSGPIRGMKFGESAVNFGGEPSFVEGVVERNQNGESSEQSRGRTGSVSHSV